MPIFRSTCCMLLHTVFSTVKELGVRGWFRSMLFIVLCNCWFRLCCMLYWVQVPHNTCYAHWSGLKFRGGAGACSVRWLGWVWLAVVCKPPEDGHIDAWTWRDIYDNKSQMLHQVGTFHHFNKYSCYKGRVLDDTTILLYYVRIEICYMFQLSCSKPVPCEWWHLYSW
jgi:hypothetical protein